MSEKYLDVLQYSVEDRLRTATMTPARAFARGEQRCIPSEAYAIPQILSVNPDLNIDSFVMPANDDARKKIRPQLGH